MPVRATPGSRAARPGRCCATWATPRRGARWSTNSPATAARFHERHYNEFVTFLPYVQRFLYGEGRARPRRRGPRCRLADARVPPPRHRRRARRRRARATRRSRCDIVHVDLYFFFDVDVVLLNVEVGADDLSLGAGAGAAVPLRPRLPGRLGRARPGRCTAWPASSGWTRDGAVLARSDAQQREPFLAHVGRAPRAAHRRALGLHAASRWCRPLRRAGRAALPPDRVLPHAADGLPGARRSARADARRLHPPRPRHRRRRARPSDAAPLPYADAAPGRLRAALLLRPLLGRRRRRAEHALPVQRPRAGRGRRRALASSSAAATAACWRSSATSTSCCS